MTNPKEFAIKIQKIISLGYNIEDDDDDVEESNDEQNKKDKIDAKLPDINILNDDDNNFEDVD